MVGSLNRIRGALGALDPAWRAALASGLVARLGLGAWAGWIWLQGLMPGTTGFFYKLVSPVLDGWQGAVLGMWQRWDGIHYQAIAENYYSVDYLSAFFPAYPLLGRELAHFSGAPALAILLGISLCATLYSLVWLYRTAAELFSTSVAERTVWGAVLFPSAFFLFGVYPQSLALLWMLLAYNRARHKRWLAAGLAGLLAGLTHGTVLPLTAMLAAQAWQVLRKGSQAAAQEQGASRLRWLALPAVAGLPLLGTALFLAWRVAMGFPGYDSLQGSDWGRAFSPPWQTLWALIQIFPANMGQNWLIALNAAMLVLAMGAVVWGVRRLPLELNLYQVTLLLYLLSTQADVDPLLSLNRLILVMFPMYFAFGSISIGRAGRLILLAAGLLSSLGLSAMFFMWKWVG